MLVGAAPLERADLLERLIAVLGPARRQVEVPPAPGPRALGIAVAGDRKRRDAARVARVKAVREPAVHQTADPRRGIARQDDAAEARVGEHALEGLEVIAVG